MQERKSSFDNGYNYTIRQNWFGTNKFYDSCFLSNIINNNFGPFLICDDFYFFHLHLDFCETFLFRLINTFRDWLTLKVCPNKEF